MKNDAAQKRSPLRFFILVYVLSAPFWVLGAFVSVEGLPLNIPITDLAATFMPLVAASILIYREKGFAGVGRLLGRAFDFRRIKQKRWYLPIIFLMPLIYWLTYWVESLAGLPLPAQIHIPFLMILLLFPAFLIAAAGEELGYMGYAVDPMQERRSALTTGLLIGVIWALWHFPSMIGQGHTATWIVFGTLGIIALRILIIWLYNNTGRSVLAAILFHTMANIGRTAFPNGGSHYDPVVGYSIIVTAAFVVTVLWGPKTLARLRLPPA